MTIEMIARSYQSHGHKEPFDSVCLTYDARFLRRKVLPLQSGASLLVELAQTTSLDDGGVLLTETGDEISVIAAQEPLLQITGPALHRLAWHIGNRHTPCQIYETRLLIQPDHVIREMLLRLDATVVDVTEPFTPEGGAYGHGRTHSHHHHDHS